MFEIGDEVFYTDPDSGISSGYYRVLDILAERYETYDDTVVIIERSGVASEVFMSELS